ncbi:MAG: hypothetical protein ACYS5W_17815, partial [Planctomycetota bacterium]
MNVRALSCCLLLAWGLAGASQVQAQGCGIFSRVDFTSYGSGCPGAGNTAPVLRGSLDTQACAVKVQLDKYQWFPNVYLKHWTLVVGTRKVAVPILRSGCTLLVQPLITAVYPRSQTTLSVPLPNDKALIGLPFHCQAGATYFG